MRVRNLALVLLLLLTALGAYYLRHPELWHNRDAVARAAPLRPPPDFLPPAAPGEMVMPAGLDGIGAGLNERSPETSPHGLAFSGACFAPPTRPVEAAAISPIYQWVDARGQVHFGDRVPEGVQARAYDTRLPPSLRYFTLEVRYAGAGQVPFLQDRLRAGATAIYEALTDLLGETRLREVALELRIYSDRAEYRAFAASLGGRRLADAGGFYSHDENLAVTFRHADDAQTLAVARHEAVHVILAGILGPGTPPWLNEGMAEYFELLRMNAQYNDVPVNAVWLRLARQSLASGYPSRLTDYLTLDQARWYGGRQEAHYALAWSLVYFLFDSPQGRQALARLAQMKADAYCSTPDQMRWLALAWPQGAAAFERDFKRWLQDASAASLHRR